MKLKKLFMDFVREEEGLTMVEYAVAGGMIAGALVLIFTDLGSAVGDQICEIITSLGGTCT